MSRRELVSNCLVHKQRHLRHLMVARLRCRNQLRHHGIVKYVSPALFEVTRDILSSSAAHPLQPADQVLLSGGVLRYQSEKHPGDHLRTAFP